MSTAKSLDQHIKKNCKHPDIEEYRANANTRSARQSPVTFEQALVPLENDTISADQTVLNQEVIVQEGAFVQEIQQPEKEKEDQEFTEINRIAPVKMRPLPAREHADMPRKFLFLKSLLLNSLLVCWLWILRCLPCQRRLRKQNVIISRPTSSVWRG